MAGELIRAASIAHRIHIARGQRVMLDRDLAALYGVETRALNQAVKRNRDRFPSDFMFELTREEIRNISQIVISSDLPRSQTVILKRGQNIKYAPLAFTEQGVAMLSSVLRSERAVRVNIAIMRAFVRLREALETNRELAQKFAELETRVGRHDGQIAGIIEAIRQLLAPSSPPAKRAIGFQAREKPAAYRVRRR